MLCTYIYIHIPGYIYIYIYIYIPFFFRSSLLLKHHSDWDDKSQALVGARLGGIPFIGTLLLKSSEAQQEQDCFEKRQYIYIYTYIHIYDYVCIYVHIEIVKL